MNLLGSTFLSRIIRDIGAEVGAPRKSGWRRRGESNHRPRRFAGYALATWVRRLIAFFSRSLRPVEAFSFEDDFISFQHSLHERSVDKQMPAKDEILLCTTLELCRQRHFYWVIID